MDDMVDDTDADDAARTPDEAALAEAMAQIEKGQQMAGHHPDGEALERARRVLAGELTRDDAIAEIKVKYGAR